MESQLIDGSDAGALERMQALLAQADAETSPDVQQQLRDEARQLEASGVLGLRYEFQKLHNLTSKLRRQALRKLIQNQPSN
jgi:uncharacterized protein YbjQ (UPF0145 family)